MTPAVLTLRDARIDFTLHEYDLSAAPDEVAQVLDIDPAEMFKTLVTESESGQLYVAVVPLPRKLDLKALAKALEETKVRLADAKVAERSTGYPRGGMSPVGTRKRLRTVIDEAAVQKEWIYVSAGRRGLELRVRSADLIRICQATVARIC
jgi:Cys-tRNA(Pro)/Cys-tRNA(Cys) deacylase